jgi:uncharacterized membrane protein YdcZ (DUF606 family)
MSPKGVSDGETNPRTVGARVRDGVAALLVLLCGVWLVLGVSAALDDDPYARGSTPDWAWVAFPAGAVALAVVAFAYSRRGATAPLVLAIAVLPPTFVYYSFLGVN